MESSISHRLTLRGGANTPTNRQKNFYSSKATMHIYSHTKFELSILITF